MNFPGPINANLSSASAVSLDGEQFAFTGHSHSVGGHQNAAGIIIPDKHLLFTGDYAREGNDLILSAPDQKYVVQDYFKGEKRPALISEDGAMLSGHIVSSLTGHVQYAQATAPDAATIIGHVMKLTGSASVIRNGVTVELNIGDAVQKGDVIQTGSDSTIAMTLIDGSAFGMTSNARMVLNEMVYDPGGSSNSSFISLVQGTVTFVAGQTAKNGNMRVETPVATMGIRGTAVAVKIYSETGVVETVLGVEPDGHTGGFAYYDNVTGALLGTVTQAGRLTIISPGGVGQAATATEQQLSSQAALADKSLFNLVYQLVFPNFNPDDSKPKSTDNPRTDIGIPPTILGKLGTDPDTHRPTVTYVIPITNPDTHVTTNLVIVYVNTPPSFAVTNALDAQSVTLGTHQFKLGDHVTITDPDIGVAPFFDVAVPYVTNTAMLVQATGPSTVVFGNYLLNSNLVSVDPSTGIVTYNPEGFRFLDTGETAVYKFTFSASSGIGSSGSDSATLTLLLTITGQNDAPTIVAGSTVALNGVTEDSGVVFGNIKTSGLITYQDFDLTDAHTVTVNGGLVAAAPGVPTTYAPLTTSINVALPGFVANTTSLGTFSITPTPEDLTDTNDTGTVAWNFVLNDSNPILQSLAEGQTITQTYKITITDSHGVPVDQIVTVTITGTNDQPVITSYDAGKTVTEDLNTDANNFLNELGVVTFSDVDLIDTHTAQVTYGGAVASSGAIVSGALATALSSALTVPTGILAAGVHTFDWNFALDNSLVQYLGEDDTITVTYTIGVTDSSLASDASALTKTVTIIIAGTNDAPVITSAPWIVQIDEAKDPSTHVSLTNSTTPDLASAQINFTDVDLSDTHVVTISNVTTSDTVSGLPTDPATIKGWLTLGPLTDTSHTTGLGGSDTWTFSAPDNYFDYLAAGEKVTLTYTLQVDDTHTGGTVTQDVTIVINGTNDAPVAVADTITNAAPPSGLGWVLNADNGHYYRYIADAYATWTDAQAAAATDGGYLATVTSAQESTFVYNLITNHTYGGTWLGGYGPVAADASSWYWTGGPEQGALFTFTNWRYASVADHEPNGDVNFTDAGLNINPDGTWNDVPTSQYDHFGGFGYVEEWGGQAGQVAFREDTGTTLTTQQLLANDTDVDTPHASLSIIGVDATSAHGGTVSLVGNIITYHPAANYNGADSFQYTLSDGSLTSTGTVSFIVDAVNDAPELIATGISVQEVGPTSPDYGSITKVLDLSLSDSDEGAANSTISAVAGHGTVTYWNGSADTSLAAGVSATVAGINAILHDGITYTPTSAPSTGGPGDTLANTDKLTVTVTDSHGASDTINFIFQQAGAPDATQLTGTTGKDLIFATEHNDSLTGLAGKDNFVFASDTGVHIVTDFTQGEDRIDLHMANAPTDNASLGLWLNDNAIQSGADTILYLDAGHTGQNEIVLQQVTLATLTANDFILHPGAPPIII